MVRAVLPVFLAFALAPIDLAAEPRCLTGNSTPERNLRLPGGSYRILWAGTAQPASPGDPAKRDWTPFGQGELTDGDERTSLPFVNRFTERVSLDGYAWGPDGYEIEVDLGRVCDVSALELTGAQKWLVVHAFFPVARRWLPIARGTDRAQFRNARLRRLRVEAGGFPSAASATFNEIRVWGNPADKGAAESTPAALAPDDPVVPYQPIQLKPAPVPAVAPDPFVFPQPQEMALREERIRFRQAVVVAPAEGDTADAAHLLVEQVSAMVDVDLQQKTEAPAEGTGIWLGLAGDTGPCGDLAGRLRLAEVPPEGYALEIAPGRVVLVGRDVPGLIWATKTFLFLLRAEAEGGASLPVGYVRDFPHSPYRVAFGYPAWLGPFKAGLLETMAAVKTNLVCLAVDKTCEGILQRHRMRRILGAPLFPQSACGVTHDSLEAAPGVSQKLLDPSRLSACASHPGFWPGMLKAFPQEKCTVPGTFVDVGYDEIDLNPWMVCARCRSRGLTGRELLSDALLKAYRYLTARGYGLSVFATSFKRNPAYDFFLDIPTEKVIVFNYIRPEENRLLSERGLTVIAGTAGGIVQITPDSPVKAGVVWNWDSAERPAMMSGTVPRMLMQAEENWSPPTGKVPFGSPAWDARQNRIMDFARRLIDRVPFDVVGAARRHFTVDLSKQANRALRDETWGDGTGWLDEGPTRDLRHLPTGRQTFAGVPYDISDRGVVVAGPGSADSDLPDQVCGIPVGRLASELTFLHTCARPVWSNIGRMVLLVGFYRVRYDDGTFVTVPVNYSQHLLEWLKPFNYRAAETEPIRQPVADASVPWRGSTDGGHDVTLYAMPWRNPYPDKTIQFIDVLSSAKTESNRNRLCLLAISGRDVEPVDRKAAASHPYRPALRQYLPRPPLPEGVTAIDLTRRTTPPQLTGFARDKAASWTTHDRWVYAQVSRLDYEKWELSYGVYSVLHPDDEAWRCGDAQVPWGSPGSGTLEIRLKRAVPLRGIGVKGVMQNAISPGFFPVDFDVSIQREDGRWRPVGQVRGHNGEEGEARWVFPEEVPATAVKVQVLDGDGLSAIALYARRGAIPPARFETRAAVERPESPGAEDPQDDAVDEEIDESEASEE
jgi:hypothetical protein